MAYAHTYYSFHPVRSPINAVRIGDAAHVVVSSDSTLDHVGVDLMQDMFTHGQPYTALSRIGCRSDAIFHLCTHVGLGAPNCDKYNISKELLV